MDQNTLRAIVTVLSFIAFLAIVWWAWSSRNKTRFEEAAMLPFVNDDENVGRPPPPNHGKRNKD